MVNNRKPSLREQLDYTGSELKKVAGLRSPLRVPPATAIHRKWGIPRHPELQWGAVGAIDQSLQK